jgi:hypothetical protein
VTGVLRGAIIALAVCGIAAGSASANVLLVGTYNGIAGKYTSIQAAVDHAKSGDWILVGPGDYHEQADHRAKLGPQPADEPAGVVISTPNIHLRGMDRNRVIVDGTRPGSPSCSNSPAAQDFGPLGANGTAMGRNGILVWKTNNTWIENLTVCNFLGGSGNAGNEVWWNGGDGGGQIDLNGFWSNYVNATSTYYGGESTAAAYGIFASDSTNGSFNYSYASNMNDSNYYVGACQQQCNTTLDHVWSQYSSLGYSGTNAGGTLVVKNSEFDHNQDGFDNNTQINGDPRAPQDGACPNNGISPITHTHSCWVFMHNNVHDNNNPNVPQAGTAALGPVGTGMTVSGGRNDTIMDNTFTNNGAWGILFAPFPDDGKPDLGQTCSGTGGTQVSGFGCLYEAYGDALLNNTFSGNGFFGNPSNADYAQIVLNPGKARNCFASNTAPKGSSPAGLEQSQPTCDGTPAKASGIGDLLSQALCDTGAGKCPAGARYPKPTGVVMHPLPANLPSMPNPCEGVPSNPWC